MLVLSRKREERIRIGRDIVVTVIHIDRNRVRLGIEAPDDIPIMRDELGEKRAPATDSLAHT